MNRLACALALLLVALPVAAAEVVTLDLRESPSQATRSIVALCSLETAPEGERGFAMIVLTRGESFPGEIERAIGMQPDEESGAFGDINATSVSHACRAADSTVLVVTVDDALFDAVEAELPTLKELKKLRDSPYSAATRTISLAKDVVAALGIRGAYSRGRAELPPGAAIDFVADLARRNRPPEPESEEAPRKEEQR
jgi:hypothetical protein